MSNMENEIHKIFGSVLDISNWEEVQKGAYRYKVFSETAYEIIFSNPNDTRPIESVEATLYYTDFSTLCPSSKYVLQDKTVTECLKCAEDDLRRREINFAWATMIH